MPTDIKLPQYICHKKVYALKIAAIEFDEVGNAKITPVDYRYELIRTKDYRSKFKSDEKDLGYWVQYEDGYISWSPSKAFEEGYTLIR